MKCGQFLNILKHGSLDAIALQVAGVVAAVAVVAAAARSVPSKLGKHS